MKRPGLHALRGIAALMIVVFHVAGIPKLELPPSLQFINSYFGLGVIFFFVLSSFSLLLSTATRTIEKNWLAGYFLRRYFRIAPLYYLMVLVFFIFNYFEWQYICSLSEIIINLSFLFNLFPGKHEGVVWASWIISVQFLFYAVFPIILVFVRSLKQGLVAYFALLAISVGSHVLAQKSGIEGTWLYMNMLNHIGVFAAGVPAFFIYKKIEKSPKKIIAAKLMMGASVLIWLLMISGWFDFAANLWICTSALAFSFLLIGQAVSPLPILTSPQFVWLGKLSFSLYLCHPLLIYFLRPIYSWIYSLEGLSLFWAFIFCCFCTLACLIPIAYAAFVLIEKNGIRLGRHIIDQMNLRV